MVKVIIVKIEVEKRRQPWKRPGKQEHIFSLIPLSKPLFPGSWKPIQ